MGYSKGTSQQSSTANLLPKTTATLPPTHPNLKGNTMKIIGAQGEVRIYRIETQPDMTGAIPVERDTSGAFIVSHSEKGHHHVIGGDVNVLERPSDKGMDILYAIVRAPTTMRQTAAVAHAEIALAPGIYEIRIDREFDPFAEQARRVAD
jgi:hypothetical protein